MGNHGNIFQGFDTIVLTLVFIQALGGIITGYVMRYADNIMKCAAVSVSICCCALISVIIREIHQTYQLFCGTLLVVFSVIGYSAPAKKKERHTHETEQP